MLSEMYCLTFLFLETTLGYELFIIEQDASQSSGFVKIVLNFSDL